jgi:predicted RNase H-like nuclease
MADMRVLGVDGARGGWLGALVDGGATTWRWSADIRELLALEADAVAIDIPIGLPDAGTRWCDRAARRLLGRRGVSVFPAPVRSVLSCPTYADARAVLARAGGASMSAQAFGIVRAVRAVDDAITAADESRVVEAHPELAFHLLTREVLESKKTPVGAARRLAALGATVPDAGELVASAPSPATTDDALDALVLTWTARRWLRGEALMLTDGSRDARAILMRIAG